MFRSIILSLAAAGFLMTGCNESTAPQTTGRDGGIKVRAPGVDVDIQKNGTQPQKKVDVNVDVNK
jgi:hypothetical protein